MKVNLQPTARTISLLKKLSESTSVVNKAKRAGMIKATNLFKMRAVEKAPIAKGTLRKSIMTEVSSDGDNGRVYSDLDYALYQEEGTGIYGPKGQPITAKKGKMMRFKSKSGKIIYTRSVKGVRPKKFMQQASEFVLTQTGVISQIIGDELEKGL